MAAVDVVIDPTLSIDRDEPNPAWMSLQLYSTPDGGWSASRTVEDSPGRAEQVELWCAQGSSGLEGKARVWRYTESGSQSGMYFDELSEVHGTIRVNAPGVPSVGDNRIVAYDLEGVRGGKRIQRAGKFEFVDSDLKR